MKFESPVTFAVVGLGRMGYRHAEQIVATEGLELKAACDVSPVLRERFQQDPQFAGARVTDDLDALLKDGGFEVVVIATPSNLHRDMSIAALEHGYHVLVEKPMAHTATEGQEMLNAAKVADRFLAVGQTVRYQPDTQMVGRVIASGKIGDVFQIYRSRHDFKARSDWQIWKEFNGGVVSNLGSHYIDAPMQMVQGQPETVFAHFNRVLDQGDAEDCYKVVIRYDNGVIVESEYLRSCYGKAMWHVCGTRGSVVIEDTLPVITMRTKTLNGDEWTEEYDFREDRGNLLHYYSDLARSLLEEGRPPILAESVMNLLRVIDAARESDRTGATVAVRYD